MKRNVEIKARASNLDVLTERVESIAEKGPDIIDQEDTFFNIHQGRLKLRKFSDCEGELIYYNRPNTAEPVESQYILSPTSTPSQLCYILSRSLDVKGVVRKRRTLYITGQTRIHLDRVEGLGTFVELEVVLRPDQDTAAGVAIAHDLMAKLGIKEEDLVKRAYVDLLK